MEEKRQIKISLKTAVLVVVILLILITIIALLVLHKSNIKNDILKSTNSEDYKEVSINDKIYYQRLSSNTWNGEYHQENFYTADKIYNVMEVVSYEKYLDTIDSINSVITDKIEAYYSNRDCNYIMLCR